MNRKGLTLVEIIAVVGIMGILALSFRTVFLTALNSWNRARVKSDIYQNMRVALDQISRDVASAIAIEGTPSFRGVSPDASSDAIEFMLIREGTIYEVAYALNGNLLERSYDEDADCDFSTIDEVHKLASYINDAQFKYWHSGTTAWEGGGGEIGAEDNWTDDWTNTGGARNDLPWAVRIVLTDSEEGREFRTIVYLANSIGE